MSARLFLIIVLILSFLRQTRCFIATFFFFSLLLVIMTEEWLMLITLGNSNCFIVLSFLSNCKFQVYCYKDTDPLYALCYKRSFQYYYCAVLCMYNLIRVHYKNDMSMIAQFHTHYTSRYVCDSEELCNNDYDTSYVPLTKHLCGRFTTASFRLTAMPLIDRIKRELLKYIWIDSLDS